MSNFQKVRDFRRLFQVFSHPSPSSEIFDQDPQCVKLNLSLILEEVQELQEAIKQKNIVETIDALSDILYVVYGAGDAFGIDLDRSFDLVHRSNLSKLCQSEQEAQETVEWYRLHEPRYDSPAYRPTPDQQNWIVYNQSTGKILKSINYHPVDLSVFLAPK